MALAAPEIRVGLTGHLYMASTGTAMPADTASALAVGWVELGYTSEDGISMAVDTSTEKHTPWQSRRPVRSDVTEQSEMFTFTLWQRNAETLKLAFGGGTIVVGTDLGDRIFTPPAASGDDDKAFVFEVIDGDIIDRYLCYKGSPTLNGDVSFTKSDVTGYEMEIEVLDSGAGTWQLLSNDPNVVVDA